MMRKCKSSLMSKDKELNYLLTGLLKFRQMLLRRRKRLQKPKLWRMKGVNKKLMKLNKSGMKNKRRKRILKLRLKRKSVQMLKWSLNKLELTKPSV